MQRTGIHLTKQGSPVGAGKINLFRNGSLVPLRPHQSVVLLAYRNKDKAMICLHESYQEKDQNSGFYVGLPDTRDADFTFFLPLALTTFVQGQFKSLRPGLEDNLAFETSQDARLRSSQMGSLYLKQKEAHHNEAYLQLTIKRMVVSTAHTPNGITMEIIAELQPAGLGPWAGTATDKDFDKDADYRLDMTCTFNKETLDFRYQGGIKNHNTNSGMTRYYPGDEVQTDLANLNLKHPLLYNTGGTYALSSEGVHAIDFQGPTRIQQVKLRGWGWGSVYDSDTVWGRNDLVLPFLTKPFLEQYLDAMSAFEGETLKASISLRDGHLGYHVEDETEDYVSQHQHPLNIRDIEAIDIALDLDRFGLVMGIDAKLSRVRAKTRIDPHKPKQGPRYTKSLMLPWEVLICREFHLPKFSKYWYGRKLIKPDTLKNDFSGVPYGYPVDPKFFQSRSHDTGFWYKKIKSLFSKPTKQLPFKAPIGKKTIA